MAYRLSRRAAADLDDIWFHFAAESSSAEIADRLIDSITDRFVLLAAHPFAGRSRSDDLGAGRRSFPVGEYLIVYTVRGRNVLILRVIHGRRDLAALFGA